MRRFILGAALAGATVTGCNLKFAADAAAPPKTPVAGTAPSTAPMIPVELKATTLAELEAFVASQKGKVVLVRCWYHGCPTCVNRFPELTDLHSRYGAYGVVCVSLNIDPAEWEERDELVAFLTKQKAGFHNFHLRDSAQAHVELRQKYNIRGVPINLLWDKSGRWQPNAETTTFKTLMNAVIKLMAQK